MEAPTDAVTVCDFNYYAMGGASLHIACRCLFGHVVCVWVVHVPLTAGVAVCSSPGRECVQCRHWVQGRPEIINSERCKRR